MKKWHEIQFVVIAVINILLILLTTVGEVLSKKNYLYKTETFTISIAILVLSGITSFLCALYWKSKK